MPTWFLAPIAGLKLQTLEAQKIFLSHFIEPSSQDQQKTFGRRLITFKVTLTGQSHFMLIFLTP